MHRSLIVRSAVVVVAASFALAGCADDDPADIVEGGGEDVVDAVEDAEEVLEDAGIDVDEEGTAEVSLEGETVSVPADESFGCFIIEDGGSQGAVAFNGETEDGFVLAVDWSGDSPEFGYVEIDLADGTLWRTASGTELGVSIEGSSATVTATLARVGDVDTQTEVTVVASCG